MSIRTNPFSIGLALALAILPCITPSARAADKCAYVVMDAITGHILDAHNENKKVQIGSLTKIATAMVVLDWATLNKRDLNEMASVPAAASAITGLNPLNLQTGDQLSLRDLLYAAMLQSDNVAAYTLADHIGAHLAASKPDVLPADRFVAHMNALARKLNLKHTLYLNPHGLEYLENRLPYSTASDVAHLAAYAMSNSAFRFFVSQKERRITIHRSESETADYLLQNTNELLGTNGIDGVKTGKTQRAGECVAISSVRTPESKKEGTGYTVTPRRLILVVLGSSHRFDTASALLESGWGAYDQWAEQGRPMKKGEGL